MSEYSMANVADVGSVSEGFSCAFFAGPRENWDESENRTRDKTPRKRLLHAGYGHCGLTKTLLSAKKTAHFIKMSMPFSIIVSIKYRTLFKREFYSQ